MTDLLHKCADPRWAESCIESLTAENARLRGRVEAVEAENAALRFQSGLDKPELQADLEQQT